MLHLQITFYFFLFSESLTETIYYKLNKNAKHPIMN